MPKDIVVELKLDDRQLKNILRGKPNVSTCIVSGGVRVRVDKTTLNKLNKGGNKRITIMREDLEEIDGGFLGALAAGAARVLPKILGFAKTAAPIAMTVGGVAQGAHGIAGAVKESKAGKQIDAETARVKAETDALNRIEGGKIGPFRRAFGHKEGGNIIPHPKMNDKMNRGPGTGKPTIMQPIYRPTPTQLPYFPPKGGALVDAFTPRNIDIDKLFIQEPAVASAHLPRMYFTPGYNDIEPDNINKNAIINAQVDKIDTNIAAPIYKKKKKKTRGWGLPAASSSDTTVVEPITNRVTGSGTKLSDLEEMGYRDIPDFKGVFLRTDTLPTYGKFIMNLDSGDNGGTHWVAVDCDNKFYFDSFGFPPPEEVKHLVNCHSSFEIQKVEEDTCGEYCLHVLREMSNSKRVDIDTMYKILVDLMH